MATVWELHPCFAGWATTDTKKWYLKCEKKQWQQNIQKIFQARPAAIKNSLQSHICICVIISLSQSNMVDVFAVRVCVHVHIYDCGCVINRLHFREKGRNPPDVLQLGGSGSEDLDSICHGRTFLICLEH